MPVQYGMLPVLTMSAHPYMSVWTSVSMCWHAAALRNVTAEFELLSMAGMPGRRIYCCLYALFTLLTYQYLTYFSSVLV